MQNSWRSFSRKNGVKLQRTKSFAGKICLKSTQIKQSQKKSELLTTLNIPKNLIEFEKWAKIGDHCQQNSIPDNTIFIL